MQFMSYCVVNIGLIVFVFPGGYDKEDKAARSYDLAALKYWGPTATTNFPVYQIFSINQSTVNVD